MGVYNATRIFLCKLLPKQIFLVGAEGCMYWMVSHTSSEEPEQQSGDS